MRIPILFQMSNCTFQGNKFNNKDDIANIFLTPKQITSDIYPLEYILRNYDEGLRSRETRVPIHSNETRRGSLLEKVYMPAK